MFVVYFSPDRSTWVEIPTMEELVAFTLLLRKRLEAQSEISYVTKEEDDLSDEKAWGLFLANVLLPERRLRREVLKILHFLKDRGRVSTGRSRLLRMLQLTNLKDVIEAFEIISETARSVFLRPEDIFTYDPGIKTYRSGPLLRAGALPDLGVVDPPKEEPETETLKEDEANLFRDIDPALLKVLS